MASGHPIHPHDKPGLGLELDPEAVKQYAV